MAQLMTEDLQASPAQVHTGSANAPNKLLHRLRKRLRKGWMRVFAQKRTREKAIDLAVTMLVLQARRHTISQAIKFNHQEQQAWNRFYRLFADSPWQTREVFRPCLEGALAMLGNDSPWVVLAADDTRVYKTGKKIPATSLQRDPQSPKYRPNLRLAQRFFQASVILPLYNTADTRARAIPVRFELAPVVKKPGKKATPQQWQEWRQARKLQNLTTQALSVVRQIRQDLDHAGATDKLLLEAGDGGFCNRATFAGIQTCPRTHLLVRCRKDASLCMPADSTTRQVYATHKFTPEQIRQDEARPWQTTRIHYGGQWRQVDYKRVDGLLWQRGAKRRELSLFVLRPFAYRTTKTGKTYYRDPAYLLTTATTIDSQLAIQSFCDRWQIEVNHREEKHDLGVGQAQVRVFHSVARHPAFLVAAYSMMQLAALECYGPTRTSDYLPLPRWRKDQLTPSCRDMSELLLAQLGEEQCENNVPQRSASRQPSPPRHIRTFALHHLHPALA